ncbi:LytR family transcriptional regulator [Paenisporosarcina quisquiliarum]|uniref:Polyisoprenyl-teichoic acid--peptidoglycan teichoic acid transferase TagU n=1 Tax=Paenisporosarcina quisquiliarum TaxID=365346 RepID=A0A9X3RE95_9BACL|nr:LytR family transcriptional regulator [Paenisporosarcina quisquiliarum]MCZ8537242.1 LytR family transcriptional regulator [Paenisporosarcina quisquiliarum]
MKRLDIKKKKKWPWVVGIVGILLLIGGAYLLTVYMSFTSTLKDIHSPIERDVSDKREDEIKLEEKEPFSLLILGVDEREGDKGRSDTIIVMSVNPNDKSTKMVSIPRDTYTEIIGKGSMDKINHAYAFGGIEMSMATVENLLDIPIDYVVQVNMEGFEDIVDAVGGVTVNNTLDFTVDQFNYPVGNIKLNGEEALSFVRMRYEDPNGDFGRQNRQKQVIQGVLQEGASVKSLMNYRSIFNALGSNVQTNMTFDEMVDVQKNYRDAVDNVEQFYFEDGTGGKTDGVWYYQMNEAELAEKQSLLKQHLELE